MINSIIIINNKLVIYVQHIKNDSPKQINIDYNIKLI